MSITTPDTHLILDVNSPKKDTREGVLDPIAQIGPDDVAIWTGLGVNLQLGTSIVGDYQKLKAWGLSNWLLLIAAYPAQDAGFSMPLGGGDSDIIAGLGGNGYLNVFIGADVLAQSQTHFFDRTVKRLIEVWLEGGPESAP